MSEDRPPSPPKTPEGGLRPRPVARGGNGRDGGGGGGACDSSHLINFTILLEIKKIWFGIASKFA